MNVNIGSLSSKISNWAKSDEGKKRIGEKLHSLRTGGSGKSGRTQAGDTVITYDQMQAVAKELISIIRRHAASADLPPSVMAHVESFCDSPLVENPDGSVSIEINMLDDAKRESVQPQAWEDGAYNIVALFNTGYKAAGSVYGTWVSAGKDIWTLRKRDGSFFLQSAIEEFNSKYGKSHDVAVYLDRQYEKQI